MRSQWVIWLLLAGVSYVYGSSCNLTEVTYCYEDLVHYESLAFPLYGEDEDRLDDTCGHIAMSYSCIKSYSATCQETPDCDEDCKEIIRDIRNFISNSGLENLAEDLCAENSPLRQTYLENVECLESNVDQYASCHNDSQKSLAYISTILDASGIDARCCYSTWYGQCFTNATKDTCGQNATDFVSIAIHKLVGHMVEILCKKTNIHCDRPPLPPEGDMKDEKDNELDKDIPNETENEIDNENPSRKGKSKDSPKQQNAATIHISVISTVILPYFSVMFFKYIL